MTRLGRRSFLAGVFGAGAATAVPAASPLDKDDNLTTRLGETIVRVEVIAWSGEPTMWKNIKCYVEQETISGWDGGEMITRIKHDPVIFNVCHSHLVRDVRLTMLDIPGLPPRYVQINNKDLDLRHHGTTAATYGTRVYRGKQLTVDFDDDTLFYIT